MTDEIGKLLSLANKLHFLIMVTKTQLKKFEKFLIIYLICLLVISGISAALTYSSRVFELFLVYLALVVLYWVVLFLLIVVHIWRTVTPGEEQAEEDFHRLNSAIEYELDKALAIKPEKVDVK